MNSIEKIYSPNLESRPEHLCRCTVVPELPEVKQVRETQYNLKLIK